MSCRPSGHDDGPTDQRRDSQRCQGFDFAHEWPSSASRLLRHGSCAWHNSLGESDLHIQAGGCTSATAEWVVGVVTAEDNLEVHAAWKTRQRTNQGGSDSAPSAHDCREVGFCLCKPIRADPFHRAPATLRSWQNATLAPGKSDNLRHFSACLAVDCCWVSTCDGGRP